MWYRIKEHFLQKFNDWITVDPASCEHEWYVVSTILSEVALQVTCSKCSTWGSVSNPTGEEWEKAVNAPNKPYEWNEPNRVDFELPDVENQVN